MPCVRGHKLCQELLQMHREPVVYFVTLPALKGHAGLPRQHMCTARHSLVRWSILELMESRLASTWRRHKQAG